MKRVFKRIFALCFAVLFFVSSCVVSSAYDTSVDEGEFEDGFEPYFEVDFGDLIEAQREANDALLSLIDERLPLGTSQVEVLPEPPPIHELMDDGGVSTFSIGTQTAYPYTGGCFMAVNGSQGVGLIVAPEDFKKDTFAFIKGTNRIVNLTNNTITCYWIRNGTTYNARFQRYGELEYYYQSGSSWYWSGINVTALTDSNVQFLDETGERGIQRPDFSLTERVHIVFMLVEIFLLLIMALRRR